MQQRSRCLGKRALSVSRAVYTRTELNEFPGTVMKIRSAQHNKLPLSFQAAWSVIQLLCLVRADCQSSKFSPQHLTEEVGQDRKEGSPYLSYLGTELGPLLWNRDSTPAFINCRGGIWQQAAPSARTLPGRIACILFICKFSELLLPLGLELEVWFLLFRLSLDTASWCNECLLRWQLGRELRAVRTQ